MAGDREEELKLHFDLEAEAGIRRGLTPDEARRAARLRLGTVSEAMEEFRDAGRFPWLAEAWRDLDQGAAALRRRPGYTLVAGGALTAAVAVNTLVFTILYGVLLEPLPYPHPERLARVFESSAAQPEFPLSIYHYEQNARWAQTLEAQALYTGADMQLSEGGRAEMVSAVAITESFLAVVGGRAAAAGIGSGGGAPGRLARSSGLAQPDAIASRGGANGVNLGAVPGGDTDAAQRLGPGGARARLRSERRADVLGGDSPQCIHRLRQRDLLPGCPREAGRDCRRRGGGLCDERAVDRPQRQHELRRRGLHAHA